MNLCGNQNQRLGTNRIECSSSETRDEAQEAAKRTVDILALAKEAGILPISQSDIFTVRRVMLASLRTTSSVTSVSIQSPCITHLSCYNPSRLITFCCARAAVVHKHTNWISGSAV